MMAGRLESCTSFQGLNADLRVFPEKEADRRICLHNSNSMYSVPGMGFAR